jgi:hypothetical protein
VSAVLALFEQSDQWSAMTKAYFYMGLGGSGLIILQMILMSVGFGDSDADADGFDDPNDGLGLISMRTLTAFSCLFGWTGFCLERNGGSAGVNLLIAGVAGSMAMFLVAWLMKWFYGMSVSGNVDMAQSMGKCGDVYLVIPGNMSGSGLVNVKLNDAIVEFKALTRHGDSIPTGSKVLVLECCADNTIIVEPYNE